MPYYRRDADTSPDPAASKRMSAVKRANTKPEIIVRKALHGRGLRYRLHVADLPGRPDIVFSKRRLVLFVHGCFWHQHPGCSSATTPRVNSAYWGPKLRRNVERDQQNVTDLAARGFRAVVLWECEIASDVSGTVERVISAIAD